MSRNMAVLTTTRRLVQYTVLDSNTTPCNYYIHVISVRTANCILAFISDMELTEQLICFGTEAAAE